jgi:uncharacterized protein
MRHIIFAVVWAAALAPAAPAIAAPPLHALLERLASAGNGEAAYHLGMLAHTGIGMPRDVKKAFAWFTKAAAAGDPLGAYKVGCFYAGQGEGVVADDPDMMLERTLPIKAASPKPFPGSGRRRRKASRWACLPSQPSRRGQRLH